MYSLIACNDLEVNKAKGVNSKLKHVKYFGVLYKVNFLKLVLYDINNISLSCFDDKRYILDDGINTLAYGHKDIKY